MCRAVKCRVCGKTTWSGCGMHVDAVRRTVPAGQWCAGHPTTNSDPSPRRSWFKRAKRSQDDS